MKIIAHQKGFGVVESLVSIALVAITLAAIYSAVVQTSQQYEKNGKTLSSRLAVSEIASEIFSHAGYFPAVQVGSTPGTYVYCYDQKGVLMKNALGDDSATIVFIEDQKFASNACTTASSFEVRLIPPSAIEEYTIDVIDLRGKVDPTNANKISSRKVKKAHFL